MTREKEDIVEINNLGDQQSDPGAEGANNQVSVEKINKDIGYILYRNPHYRVTHSHIQDEIGSRYKILVNKPLKQFDTNFAKAYKVLDKLTGKEDDFYAIIFDKKYPIRLSEINQVKSKNIDNFVNVVESQVVKLSIGKGSSYVAVLKYPKGITLRQFISDNGPMSETVITKYVIPTINDVIGHLIKRNVTHGLINPDNIYIDSEGVIMVGECFSEPCGYSQHILYESLNRAMALSIGKGSGDRYVDFYALGVLAVFLYLGFEPNKKLSDLEILENKLNIGTYAMMVGGREFSGHMLDLLRGVLNDKKFEAWSSENIAEWSNGRRFNLLPPTNNFDASRPIIFNGGRYRDKKSLAHAFHVNWDEAKKFIRDDELVRWIDRSVQDEELAERMEIMSNRRGSDKAGDKYDKDDELLTQYILLLDPSGPLRLKEFSVNVSGMGVILAYYYAQNNKEMLDAISYIIKHNFIVLCENQFAANEMLQEVTFGMQKSNEMFKKKDKGFGLFRCLYELNPTLACQSPLIVEDLVLNTDELLHILDKDDSIKDKILDDHMFAFIYQRHEIPIKIRIPMLAKFPDFASNEYIQTLATLSYVQQTNKIEKVLGLTLKIQDSFTNVIKTFRSKTIRDELTNKLQHLSNYGSVPKILKLFSEPKYLIRDRVGFSRAAKQYKNNAIKILRLSNRVAINNVGYRYGLQLSVMISFFMAMVTALILIFKIA